MTITADNGPARTAFAKLGHHDMDNPALITFPVMMANAIGAAVFQKQLDLEVGVVVLLVLARAVHELLRKAHKLALDEPRVEPHVEHLILGLLLVEKQQLHVSESF